MSLKDEGQRAEKGLPSDLHSHHHPLLHIEEGVSSIEKAGYD
jgi:hypothetical protein